MSSQQQFFAESFRTPRVMTEYPQRFIHIDSNGLVDLCQAGEYAEGVLENTTSVAGCPVSVSFVGITKITVDGPYAIGTYLMSGADGIGTQSTAGNLQYSRAKMLEASVASGDIVSCRLLDDQIGGAQGSTGIVGIGATGIRGMTGIAGMTGIQGLVGLTGLQGIDGQTGIQGLTGETGIQGLVGLTGLQGVDGQTGIQGLVGETGIQGLGLTGLQGIDGQTGIQGLTGETGIQGLVGLTGLQGMTGIQGLVGETGIQGLTGETGIQGLTGFYGQTGIRGLNTTADPWAVAATLGSVSGWDSTAGVYFNLSSGQTGIFYVLYNT